MDIAAAREEISQNLVSIQSDIVRHDQLHRRMKKKLVETERSTVL
jgi:hypothetical protein